MLFIEKPEAKNHGGARKTLKWQVGPLTKQLHKDSIQPLLQVMKSGHHTLCNELDEEEFRQQETCMQRLKGKVLSDEPTLV